MSKRFNEKHQIIRGVISTVGTAREESFDIFYLPLLKTLAKLMKEEKVGIQDPAIHVLYQQILGQYVVRFVGSEPKKPDNWTKQAVSCNCTLCIALNEFLVSPREQIYEYSGHRKNRNHLCFEVNRKWTSLEDNPIGKILTITKTHKDYELAHEKWKPRRVAFTKYMESFSEKMLMKLLGDWFWPILAGDVVYIAAALEEPATKLKVAALAVKNDVPDEQVRNDISSDEDDNAQEESFVHI